MMSVEYFTTLDGCRIAYRWDGIDRNSLPDAPILMLSNSLGTNMHMWDPQMAVWNAEFAILRYDSRGHGASGSPIGDYSMDRLGRDVIELLIHLELERVHFCGLSKGGMVGQWLAVHAPQYLDKLVLANTAAYMGPPSNWQRRINSVRQHGVAPLADASIARWFTANFPSARPDLVAPIHGMLLANDPVGYSGCCAAIRDMDQRPTAILNRTPTLVVAGSKDLATSVEDGRFLAEVAEQGRLVILPAAHLSNVEHPEKFGRLVREFLTGQIEILG